MVTFSGPAIIEFHPSTDHKDWFFTVHEEFTVRWKDKTLSVPTGITTDLASIPLILQNIMPLVANHLQAAIVHDMCYRSKIGISRKEADDMFYDSMRVLGVNWFKAQTMYRAVRLFGWRAFKGG